jgi:hypothetical protein
MSMHESPDGLASGPVAQRSEVMRTYLIECYGPVVERVVQTSAAVRELRRTGHDVDLLGSDTDRRSHLLALRQRVRRQRRSRERSSQAVVRLRRRVFELSPHPPSTVHWIASRDTRTTTPDDRS